MKILKKITLTLLLILGSISNYTKTDSQYDFNCPEKKIVVVIPSYNNREWIIENLDSVRLQCYQNFEIIYINDNSTDDTIETAETYKEVYKLEDKLTIVNNKIRVGALANLYKAIHSCQNDSIIVTLDGDDWLAHPYVLKIINSVYQDPSIWMTYGSYRSLPECKTGFCKVFGDNVIKHNLFRKTSLPISHLRTFYAGLFKLIKFGDLLYEGEFYQMAWDKTIMAPIIEMAGPHHKFIEDILYHYNNANPINDHRVNEQLQRDLCKHVLSKPPYSRVQWEDIISAKTKIPIALHQ